MEIVTSFGRGENLRIREAFRRADLWDKGQCFRTKHVDGEVIGMYSRTQFGTDFVSLLGRTGPRDKYHDVASPAIDEAAREHFATGGE